MHAPGHLQFRWEVVFRTNGFGVIFSEDLAGEDFDGDGNLEVMFQTDTAGDNYCSWTYNVVSLVPKPHRLFNVGKGPAVQFEKDKQGKMLIWERTPGPNMMVLLRRPPAMQSKFLNDGNNIAQQLSGGIVTANLFARSAR